jgi:acetoin utilization deacetylase AcuC-like enzyme
VRTWWSATHRGHRPETEVRDGRVVPHVEVPARADAVLDALVAADLGPVAEVVVDEPAVRVAAAALHDPGLVDFLAGAWDAWRAAGRDWYALPTTWPVPGLGLAAPLPVPHDVEGRLGHWCFDAATPVGPGTWPAAVASAACALAAADDVADRAGPGTPAPRAFALCRPPGHHAAPAAYGGYCYLNNAALAAQRLRDRGAERVAVLDVDYHHGNGTQAVFWERADVLTVSLHADPHDEYPFFSGHAAETGAGAGAGANRNLPLPPGTGWDRWSEALDAGLAAVAGHRPEALVVALGVDTYEGDPLSRSRLATADYPRIGARIGALGLPTVAVLEGGYAVDAIGANVTGALAGLAG